MCGGLLSFPDLMDGQYVRGLVVLSRLNGWPICAGVGCNGWLHIMILFALCGCETLHVLFDSIDTPEVKLIKQEVLFLMATQ